MPDSVKIGIESTFNGSGVSQAEAAMTNLGQNAARLGGLYGAALDPASKFSQRTDELTAAFKRGDISARQYESGLKSATWQAMSFGEKTQALTSRFHEWAKGVQTFALNATGAAVAVGYAGKKMFEFAESGAQIEYTAEKFDRLSRSVGTTGNIFLNQLRTATKGTVSDFELMSQGADLFQLGLAKDSTEAIRLSRVMTALGMDTGQLTLALANQSKKRLDQLGLSLSKFNEIEAKLKDSGLSKEDAFKEAFLQTAEQTVVTTGNRADSDVGNFLRLRAEATNFWNSLKQGAPNMSLGYLFGGQSVSNVAGQLAGSLQGLTGLISGKQHYENIGWNPEAARFEGDLVASTQYNRIFKEAQKQGSWMGTRRGLAPAIRADLGYGRNAPGATVAGVTMPEAIPVDYGAVLKGGMDLTQMSEQYTQKSDDLNQALSEQMAIMDQLSMKYAKTSKDGKDAFMEQADKVDALKQSVKDLDTQYADSMNQIAMNTLKAKGASDEQQIAFARATGLMSQGAADQAMAMDKMTSAFMNGGIDADTYASGIANLNTLLRGLNGARADMYIDVWIRQHGSIPGGGNYNTAASTAPTASVGGSGTTGTGQNAATVWMNANKKWTGGPLTGDVTLVGDAPGGGMTPYTEAIIDGYVFDAQTTRKLYEAGLLNTAVGMRSGGEMGGGTTGGYTYGGRTQRQPKPSKRESRMTLRSAPMNGSVEGEAVDANTIGAMVQASQQQAEEKTAQNFKQASQQTTQTQKETSGEIVAAIERQTALIARLPTRSDAYSNARAAQQMNI